jgi:hypothetical protein
MTPREQIASIRGEIANLRGELANRFKQISEIENSCYHEWLPPMYVPRKVDYDQGAYGGSYEERKWERECANCGKRETTYKEIQVARPDFGDDHGRSG